MVSVFVPDADYVNMKYEELKSRFDFAYSIIETIQVMEAQFGVAMVSEEAPKIKIDLGSAKSKYNWGTECYVLDLSWYSEYKPMVDNILSAIMWGFFIWRLFVRLPSIINGVGSVADLDSRK